MDGLSISIDSPEAFDEVIYKIIFPEIYKNSWIEPLTEAHSTKKNYDFLISNFVNKALLKFRNYSGPIFYISKNNANISRIPFIRKSFPKALMVAIIRDPASHAALKTAQKLQIKTKARPFYTPIHE